MYRLTRVTHCCAGLEVDPSNEGFKAELENLKRPPRRQAGGLFGPEFLGKLAMSPQTSQLMTQPDFLAMIKDVNSNPSNMSKWASVPMPGPCR